MPFFIPPPNNKTVTRYLTRFGEPEHTLATNLIHDYHAALVIPAYGEGKLLFQTLQSVPILPHEQRVLVIVVLNARQDSPPEVLELNNRVRQKLALTLPGEEMRRGREKIPKEATSIGNNALYKIPQGSLLLIERLLPRKQGVGLARKIGADVALAAWQLGILRCHFIHTTDADVILPKDYFLATAIPITLRDFESAKGLANTDTKTVAWVYPFKHIAETATLEPFMLLYELWLREYVEGLKWAGSPYAYHAIGSTIAFTPVAYAQVGGIPKRQAGEDFYLLNKLNKVGAIAEANAAPIHISGRISTRNPFGTGPTLARRQAGEEQLFYNPNLFIALKIILVTLQRCWEHDAPLHLSHLRATAKNIDAQLPLLSPHGLLSVTHIQEFCTGIDRGVMATGLLGAIMRAKAASSNNTVQQRHFHHWFDALRTLQLLHLWEQQSSFFSPITFSSLLRLNQERGDDEYGRNNDNDNDNGSQRRLICDRLIKLLSSHLA